MDVMTEFLIYMWISLITSNNLHPSSWGEDPTNTDQSRLHL